MKDSREQRSFDAIVVGSGISGGWAAKELCERGLRTLVLERGGNVEHGAGYSTSALRPWELEHGGRLSHATRNANPIASRCWAFQPETSHFFVKDAEHPYVQDKPFDWIRGYQVGGRSLTWSRHAQRWSPYDFEGPARDGFAVDWPIRYDDLAPWYSHVERFIGVSGNNDGLATLPDGEFLPPHEMTEVERAFKTAVEARGDDRHVVMSRRATVTELTPAIEQQGRSLCDNRGICERGCPHGGYFSSNASTLPWAAQTGLMVLRPDSVVHSIMYDNRTQRAVGVRVIDAHSNREIEYYAKVVFLNASTLNSNLILLNSTSNRFPMGLGNDNGLLGTHIAFHNYRATISARFEGSLNVRTTGRRPNDCYIPRFRNVHRQETDFLRGYSSSFSAVRNYDLIPTGLGRDLIESILNPPLESFWQIYGQMVAETIPKIENRVTLDSQKCDQWGVPLLHVEVGYDDNDERIIRDFFSQMTEMYSEAGFTDIETLDSKQAPGLDIHEMGGVRMGRDPDTSLLNGWNQLHSCRNVFVTDGACMTSTGTQAPSLTYMALTARAANHAADEIRRGVL